MRGTLPILLVLSTCASLVSCAAGRSLWEHGASPGDEVATHSHAELEAWMRRHVGQFSIDVSVVNIPVDSPCDPIRNPAGACGYVEQATQTQMLQRARHAGGSGECHSVGAGPGVRCMFNVVGSEGAAIPGLPFVLLYGTQPDDLVVHLMEVDVLGPARIVSGSLKGETATFRGKCAVGQDAPPDAIDCDRVVRIRAPRDGRRIEISIESTPSLVGRARVIGQAITRIELRRNTG